MTQPRPPRDGQAGVTLIEMMVALALFALIAGAGFSVLDQVLRSQRLTEGRLERLAGMQRVMHLFSSDMAFAQGRSLRWKAEAGVTLRRTGAEGDLDLGYALQDGTLTRVLDGGRASQPLLTGVEAVTWRFLDRAQQWQAEWPRPGTEEERNPRAIELVLVLAEGAGPRGTLRRVVAMPEEAE